MRGANLASQDESNDCECEALLLQTEHSGSSCASIMFCKIKGSLKFAVVSIYWCERHKLFCTSDVVLVKSQPRRPHFEVDGGTNTLRFGGAILVFNVVCCKEWLLIVNTHITDCVCV